MNIPEIKLHVKLEWHLGIPDGERSCSRIFDYTDNEYDIEDILDKIALEYKLVESTDVIEYSHYGYSNEYTLWTQDRDLIGNAYVKPVLFFNDKIFKLEEI